MKTPSVSWRTSRKGTPFSGIGSLEAEILASVWERHPESSSVRDVYEELLEERHIAYTTVMTVMGNLVKKGLLERDDSRVTYLYRAAIPADEVAGEVLESVVVILYRKRTGAALARLLGLTGELSEAQVAELTERARELLGG